MKTIRFMNLLRQLNVGRLRLVNIKLWGNRRSGLYRELPTEAIPELIREFNRLTASPAEPPAPARQESSRAGSNYAILARLCEQYYVYEGSEKLQQRVIAEVKAIVRELRNDDEAHAEFEAQLNARHNNLLARFRAEHPSFKEKDYRLYAYLVAGLSATTIAVLLDKEKSVVYNRISRLKKSLKAEWLEVLN